MSLTVSIEKSFGSFVLHADFVAENGVTGLLGASGSGKSMTLKCIAGIERPDRGRIVLDGVTLFDSEKKINLPPQQRKVGYLFQSYALFPNMDVRQNILCGMQDLHSRQEKEERLQAVLTSFQLTGLQHHRPHQLSGGQAQRVALARIVASRPRLLMLDEPFSALDAHLRVRLQMEMKAMLSSYQGSVLMVTHNRDEAYHLCDHIAIVDRGRLHGVRRTKALFADPQIRAAALLTGCKNITEAVKTGEHELFAPAWGVTLTTAQPLRDDLCGVAFRAHYLNPNTEHNRLPVCLAGEMEEPFEWILLLRYQNQQPETDDLWWRIEKSKRPQTAPKELGLAPVNVLPLYPDGD